MFRSAFPLATLLLASTAGASTTDFKKSYQHADDLRQLYTRACLNLVVTPHWLANSSKLWYRSSLPGGKSKFYLVDEQTGVKTPAFDQARLAKALATTTGKSVDPEKLPFTEINFSGANTLSFVSEGTRYSADLTTYVVTAGEKVTAPARKGQAPWNQDLHPADGRTTTSPDGKYTASITGANFSFADKATGLTNTIVSVQPSYYSRLHWSPDSSRLLAIKVTPGDRKTVTLIQSSPPGGGRAVVTSRPYDLPGDKVDTYQMLLINPQKREEVIPVKAEDVDYGDMPEPRWERDGYHFTYEKMDRGYGRWRLIEVDIHDGSTKELLDDHPKTFVDSTSQYIWYSPTDNTIVWRSEKDGWGHLYLLDNDRQIHQITSGPWVVRAVDKVDEASKTIWFQGSGKVAGEDPYDIHYYKVNFDGSGLVDLTPEKADHKADFSPDGKFLVDDYSTVEMAPVHTLRSAQDQKLIATLETADISGLKKIGFRMPEPFVAKGRDGKTDIYGVVYRPSNWNPNKKYPIIENIYAGPQDSFVPKFFAPWRSMASLSELGFVVVQIDGMGTRNRGKAFHDVCYKNLADAGFPDRILWMKALAAKDRSIDIKKVGVYGTSAGGQNSTGALLFHPEFYKVAVSSCGCHDNRMDKIWWNEQWMGLMGPQYDEDSNIINAHKLQGKLLLFVGEQDHNVPPESTFRLVDALVKAGKEFSFLVLPGFDHTDGGPYGERKRRDFFVKNLLNEDPPNWNETTQAK